MEIVIKSLMKMKDRYVKDKSNAYGWFAQNVTYYKEQFTKYGTSFRSFDSYMDYIYLEAYKEETRHPTFVQECGDNHRARYQKFIKENPSHLQTEMLLAKSDLNLEDSQKCQAWLEGSGNLVKVLEVIEKGKKHFKDFDGFENHLKYLCKCRKWEDWTKDSHHEWYEELGAKHKAKWDFFDKHGKFPQD